ncbi:FAD-binding oxidoreductase [Candidimonas humi]|uniref:NAD(P)/FAD-dependent oxidoreductase n=1 Tax=Candidimonas humi TaxID=683355 RepID=A0ABV8NX48_9BURK|nr:FAD-dependent oxidoreductase [Candidimonas humi]MBV6303979.1 FAD-binding oxidoreductase [Candidimonas humi]
MKAGSDRIAVIGAGIVGVCIAHELRKRGRDVVLVDRDAPGNACSFGNSGAISEGSVVPLAMPGVLKSVPGMLCDPEGPLYLPPGYLPQALPWLARFALASRRTAALDAAARLAAVHRDALQLHLDLAREVGAPELILRRGHLYLYPDEAALAKDMAGWRLREQYGFRAERLDRGGILALEPGIAERYRVGMFLADHATVANPWRYVQAIFQHYLALGGAYRRAEVRGLAPDSSGWRIDCADAAAGDTAGQVVVAAGAWSRKLLDPLGVSLPLESQRGYHVQFEGGAEVSRTVVLADRKVFITPMETGLRVGGTVDIGGLSAAPNPRRSQALLRIALSAFPSLSGRRYSTWMGHRPCMPDSVPRIGPAPGRPGLWLAVGHGHLGLTDSAGTARSIAEGMLSGTPLN